MILWIVLLVISVALVTPVLLTEYWKKLEASIELEYSYFSKETINEYVTSLTAMIVSIIMIPALLDLMVLMEDWKTKSQRQVALLNRNYVFMIINMLFLNLTGLMTIKSLLWEVEKQDLQTWPQFMAQKALSNYSFFISYFIQLMFLSVGFWLLDIPHIIVRSIKECYHKANQARKEHKQKFVDDYAFDLGYHSAYSLTTFAIAMVFSVLVPYVPVFAMFFFMFKYYVDKYNLSFNYNTEFRSIGIIKGNVVPLLIFNIIIYQFINIGFFASKALEQGRTYLYCGLCIVGFELLCLMVYQFWSKFKSRQAHKNMRDMQKSFRK